MYVRLWAGLLLVTFVGASCGVGDDDDGLTVTVVKGVDAAPDDLRQAQGPTARYLADSEVILFVTDPLYSGSCTPEAEAEADTDGTVTLTIDDSHDGNCTADANSVTVLIQGFADPPTDLIVLQEGQEDIELELSAS